MSEGDVSPARKRRRWLYPAVGAGIIAAGAAVGIGPAAPWAVDQFADGARVWRLGHIQVDGVSGGWLGALRAETITIADGEGVWLEAHGLALEWRPLDAAFGAIRVNAANADSIIMHRQPTLLEATPPSGRSFDVRLANIHVEHIEVAEAAYAVEADFTADFGMHLAGGALHGLELSLIRTDSDDDRIVAFYQGGGDYALSIDAVSAPGGVVARALGVGEQGLQATARGNGDINAGSSAFEAFVGEQNLLSGTTTWRDARWSGEAQAQLDALPLLEGLAQRIGPSVTANFAGEQRGVFNAHAETPFIAIDVEGELDEDYALEGPVQFTATTSRLSDIARESPFELGAATMRGELRQARLRTDLAYDRQRRRFSLDTAELTGDALAFDAQGYVSGGGEFSGDWRVRRLAAISEDLTGEAGGRWRAFADEMNGARIWTTAIEGRGANVAGAPAIIPQLLGDAPELDARLAYKNGGITVSHARVDGARLRAGATGRIVRGDANLALEASARGPLTLGGAEIIGAVDATGRLTGRIARPTLSARASLTSFAAGGVIVEQPVVDFTLAPSGRGYAGRAEAQGSVSGQAFNAAANVSVAGGALALTDLDGQIAALQAQGAATFSSVGVTADLDVNGRIDGLIEGVSGRMAGAVALTPETVTLDAQIADARAGELRMRAATLRAHGPVNAIAAQFSLRGRLREAPLAFEGTGALDLEGDATLSIEGRGTLADADIFTRAPMRGVWRDGGAEASLDVAVGDGIVRAHWTDRGRTLNGSAQIDDAPLAPLAAIWGERASGRIDGALSVASNGRGLGGSADITLNDARFAGRQRGTLDVHIVGDLDPGRIQAVIDATSTDGLVARFEANAPVVTSTNPIRIALAPERRGRATWTVSGPAASIWAAARLPDQSLQGQLEGEGELSFGAGYLSGAGYLEVVDGRFEDKLTGVTLIDLNARVAIDDRGMTIENFTASGPRGGRVTATGGSANQREGRVAVSIADMRVANRPDASATASGELTLAWEGLHSELTGELNILEANLDIASAPEAGIPTLDVIEINRPGEFDDEEEEAQDDAPQRNGSTELAVRVTAPGRVFTRGRGIDAEWALDMRLEGTLANPRVFGTARAVRGTLSLSGQPFEIDEARISFTGDPIDARIDLTAARSTADLTAYLRLTGTARSPEISFTSDPPLPEDEILPQVLFGRSVEDLSGLEAAQLAASLAALSGRGTFDIVDSVRAAAGLDRFNVRQDEDGGFLVAGGVYLTRDVYVEVARTGLGQAQTRVEWTVRPRLVLITSFLGNGDQRVSLRWRRETD